MNKKILIPLGLVVATLLIVVVLLTITLRAPSAPSDLAAVPTPPPSQTDTTPDTKEKEMSGFHIYFSTYDDLSAGNIAFNSPAWDTFLVSAPLGTPLVSDKDIASYAWDTQTITLTESASERIRDAIQKNTLSFIDVPFLALLGDERVFGGMSIVPMAARAYAHPVLYLDTSGGGAVTIRLRPTHDAGVGAVNPKNHADSIGSERVYAFFLAQNKITQQITQKPNTQTPPTDPQTSVTSGCLKTYNKRTTTVSFDKGEPSQTFTFDFIPGTYTDGECLFSYKQTNISNPSSAAQTFSCSTYAPEKLENFFDLWQKGILITDSMAYCDFNDPSTGALSSDTLFCTFGAEVSCSVKNNP